MNPLLLSICLLAHGASAFAPAVRKSFAAVGQQRDQRSDVTTLSMNQPFFASSEEESSSAPPSTAVATSSASVDNAKNDDMKSLEEEIEELTKEEVRKMKRASNLRNANGVEYAPWMNITPEAEAEIKAVMKAKAEARRRRKDQEAGVSGALLMDSQAQELSGGGLTISVVSDNEVELNWATNSETSTSGFAIKRRPARTDEFETIVSWETWGPLASKGPTGGSYTYLDDSVSPGGWVYRVTECEKNGSENDICQALVDVQTAGEQRGAVIAAVGIVVIAIAAVAAGLILDPVGGY